jgi:hypothetical protein
VAEAVVNSFEVIKVDEQNGHANATLEHGLQLVPEERPVGQAGERIVGRLVLDLGLTAAKLGQGGPLLRQQAGVGQGDRRLVGQADQAGLGVVAGLQRWSAVGGGRRDDAEELATGDDWDDDDRS